MPDEFSDLIPGVSEAEVAGAVQSLTKIPVTALEDRERFTIAVRSLVESRAQSGWPNEGSEDVGVFILAEYPREVGERYKATPVSDLIATEDPILGKLFFLNRDASSGRGVALPVAPNDIIEWITDQKLETLPMVVVHRNKKLMISRTRGAAGDTRNDLIRDKPPVASIEEIHEALKLSHRELLLTPSICPAGVWEPGRSNEYVPGPLPEKAIQRQLATVLTSWFHGVVKAEMEDSISMGRIDIRLLRPDVDGKFAYWVVLELKVIKSNKNAKKKKKAKAVKLAENVDAVAEGIRQASAFGKDRKAEPFLEIYDLRKDKSTDILGHITVVNELNKSTLKPQCRVWPLFGSASDARIAGWP